MSDDILNEFKDVDGLEEVIEGIKDIGNFYKVLYKASKTKTDWDIQLDDEVDKLLQVKLARKILKTPIIYKPPLSDVIIRKSFYSLFLLINWVYWIHNPKTYDIGYNKQSKILECIMTSLDNFDKTKSFEEPNEEFYKKLKGIKWDKEGKTLFGKLNGIRWDINYEQLGLKNRNVYITEDHTITFLTACNAVNHNRDKMLEEDVIIAHKTYLKLLNTDITKINVLNEDLNQISPEFNMGSIETSDDELIKERTSKL